MFPSKTRGAKVVPVKSSALADPSNISMLPSEAKEVPTAVPLW